MFSNADEDKDIADFIIKNISSAKFEHCNIDSRDDNHYISTAKFELGKSVFYIYGYLKENGSIRVKGGLSLRLKFKTYSNLIDAIIHEWNAREKLKDEETRAKVREQLGLFHPAPVEEAIEEPVKVSKAKGLFEEFKESFVKWLLTQRK